MKASDNRIGAPTSGRPQAPRLLTRFARNPLPSLRAFLGARKEPVLAAIGLDRNDTGDAEFRSFLDRPFEALELDQRQVERQPRKLRSGRQFLNHVEADQNPCGPFRPKPTSALALSVISNF